MLNGIGTGAGIASVLAKPANTNGEAAPSIETKEKTSPAANGLSRLHEGSDASWTLLQTQQAQANAAANGLPLEVQQQLLLMGLCGNGCNPAVQEMGDDVAQRLSNLDLGSGFF